MSAPIPPLPTPKRSIGALVLQGTIALSVTGVTLVWAFRGVELGDVADRLRGTSVPIALLFVAAQILAFFLRVVRWDLLVRPLGDASRGQVFAAAAIGFPATFFLPLRLGEFVRPLILARAGVPFAGVMASVVVERITDGVVALGVFFVMLRFLPVGAAIPDELRTYSTVALVLFGGALLGLIGVVIVRRPALVLLGRLLGRISEPLRDRVIALLESFLDGATALRSAPRILAFLLLTAAFWATMCSATWALALCYAPDLPYRAGYFASSVVTFAIMIPAGPAFAGTMEAGFRVAMVPFGIDPGATVAIAVAVHALQLVAMALVAGAGYAAHAATFPRSPKAT